MTCEALEELAGAYALDAVSEDEHRAIEEHVAVCPHCQQIIQELQTAVELLPAAAPLHEPSTALKGRIMAAIEAESAPRPILMQPRLVQQQKKRRLNWSTSLIAAAAICLLALSSGLTAWNVSLQQQLAHLTTTRPAIVTHTYTIQGTTTAPEAKGQLVYLPTQQTTLVTLRGLPDTTGQQVYQGWLLHCQKPVSIGLFNVVHGVAALNYPGDISSYELTAVSLEPGPGASQGVPKGQIVATGKLDSGPSNTCHG